MKLYHKGGICNMAHHEYDATVGSDDTLEVVYEFLLPLVSAFSLTN